MSQRNPYGPAILSIAVVAVLSGCHSYRAVDTPPVGSTVRIEVPVTAAVTGRNAQPSSMMMEGQVLQSGDTLVLATSTRREFGAFREVTLVDTLRLAQNQTSRIEIQEFSRGKSIGLGVAIAAGAAGLAIAAFTGGGGDGDLPGGPPIPETAIVVDRSLLSAVWSLVWKAGGG